MFSAIAQRFAEDSRAAPVAPAKMQLPVMPSRMNALAAPAGVAPPQQAASAYDPSKPVSATNNPYYDPSKLAAAQAAQGVGADGRTILNDKSWLSLLNPLSGVKLSHAASDYTQGMGDSGESATTHSDADYTGPGGQRFIQVGTDPDGSPLIKYQNNNGKGFYNPTGNEGKDFVQPTYKLGKDGTATPVSAGTNYQASNWVDGGRDIVKNVAAVAAAGLGGAYLGAGNAVGGAGIDIGSGLTVGSGVGAGGAGLDAAAAAALAGQSVPGAGLAAAGAVGGGAGGLAGTGLPAYSAYTGPGSGGYQVAGDVAVAPGGAEVGSDAAMSLAEGGYPAGLGTLPAPAGGLTAGEVAGGVGAAGSAGGAVGGGGDNPDYSPVTGGGQGGPGTSITTTPGGPNVIGTAGEVAGAGSSWMDLLKAGDIAGAVKAGGSGVLDFLTSGPGLGMIAQLGAGYLGSQAAKDAAETQAKSAADANALAKYMYDTTRGDNMPALTARNDALNGLQGLMKNPGSVTSDPGYAWQLAQGQKGVDNSATKAGGYYSGQQLKGASQYNTNFATSKLNDSYNRLASVAGVGQVGAGTIANAGTNYANTAGANTIGAGNANASGYVGSANSWSNALSNIFNQYQQNQFLKGLGIGP